ncbi:MAG: hypothetical protein WAU68_04945, partial [Vitreimonas sp.]
VIDEVVERIRDQSIVDFVYNPASASLEPDGRKLDACWGFGMPEQFLAIDDLSARHPGITANIGPYYAEAAAVCLSRHHQTPISFALANNDETCSRLLAWTAADEATKAAWANWDDATRDAAYCLALAAIEDQRQLVAVGRAQTHSGADYLLLPSGTAVSDFESAIRLEVSGTDAGSNAVIARRTKEKLEQTKRGESDSPAIAAVVGFKAKAITLQDLVNDDLAG